MNKYNEMETELEIAGTDVEREPRGTLGAVGKSLDAPGEGFPLQRASRDQLLPLSSPQQRLWFIHQSNPESTAYNIAFSWKISGALQPELLERSIDAIVQRHEVFRTVFPLVNGLPHQKICSFGRFKVETMDLRALPDAEGEAKREVRLTAHNPFDLAVGPLFRAQLFRITDEEHLLLLVVHHIIFDGTSLGVFFRELRMFYKSFLEGGDPSLPKLSLQYADYAVWQKRQSEGEVVARQLEYWKEQLGGPLPILELPSDHPRPAVQTSRGAMVRFNVPRPIVDALHKIQQQERTTIFSIYLAAFNVLLFRYTREEDIIVGTLANGRNLPELSDQIGFFVNTHALRTFVEGDLSFCELLFDVFENWLNAIENQDVPFDKLVEAIKPTRDLSHTPIFQVLFSFQSLPAEDMELAGLKVQSVPIDCGVSKFDLCLDVNETADGAACFFEYNSDLFERETMQRMASHFCKLLEAIGNDPSQEIRALEMIPESEIEQMAQWNRTELPYAKDACIPELFQQQAQQHPEKTALVDGDRRLRYGDLDTRSNQLAQHLRSLGVGPDALVGLCLERSIDLVVAILGILKSGGAYVPIDPAYPKDRQIFTLQDSGAALLLTSSRQLGGSVELREWAEQGGAERRKIICVDTEWESISQADEGNVSVYINPSHLAYVLFTSGSTGKPKGVAIEHRSVAAFAYWAKDIFSAEEFDGVLFSTSVCFDLSVFELLVTLAWGGKVIIAENALALPTLPTRNEVRLINTVPSAMAELLRMKALPASIQTVNLAGEALPMTLVDEIYATNSVRRVFDLYGPTETTTYSTFTLRKPGEPANIGRPLANEQIYILDEYRQMVPIGVPGELHIAGAGLARGYLNRPDLTQEKFVPNPFSEEPGARMYRTGDLARYRADGTIEYLGRLDNQVKIRGFRIELGEIETVLRQHANVREAVVVARETTPGNKRLIAYAVPKSQSTPETSEIKQFIGRQLPEFMIPSVFVWLDALPLTPNGKVDRRALPIPDAAQSDSDSKRIPPRNQIEQTIAQIWQEALGLSKVGVHDNFFDLGGHSLLVARVHNQLSQTFAKEIPMVEMFRHSTIDSLAGFFAEDVTDEKLNSKRQTRQRDSKEGQPERIAIVGMAGRFPGANNVEEFWRNLRDGVEGIFPWRDEDLLSQGVSAEELQDPNYVKAGTALENLDQFDAGFFGFNPKEAEILDPQHRLFLEAAWEALENAGCNPDNFPGAIGVYAGSSMNTYAARFGKRSEMAVNELYQAMIGNDKDFLATRVSYKLNLRGPSFAVQTACSTSLVAVQLACQSLLAGECDMALAGGVCANQPQRRGYLFQEGMILSPDGHCRAFDAEAQGTVSGMGVGIVALKRLSDALEDGDTIQAIILGGAINNDGAEKVGYTAPSISGQAEVVKMAQAAAQVDPETITYIEAHGTGTPMGDPIEIAALTQAFREKTEKKQFCAVGSVKSNLGHLDVAAGVTGLIKTVLALRHKAIPPSLHFEQPNPKIDFENSPFYVNATLQDWKTNGAPRRAGVSAFGIGGTNAHLVLEEAPSYQACEQSRPHQLFLLSSKTDSALSSLVGNLANHLKENPETNLPDVAHTLQSGRKHFEQRCFAVGRNIEETIGVLEDPEKLCFAMEEPRDRKIVFLFSGQGAQHFRMAWDIYQQEELFRETFDACAEILRTEIGCDIRVLLFHDEDAEAATRQLNQTAFAQPALFAIEYALAKLWISWGIQPEAMLGHSIGEYVAACLSGVFSLEDALRLVAERGRLMQRLPGGSMLVVPLSEKNIQPFLNDHLALAASNGPCLNVVSGENEAIEKLAGRLTGEGLNCKRLHTSHAFHSPMMEPILEAFTRRVTQVQLNAPKLPYISNLTGTWIEPKQATDPAYWAKHLRNTVRFSQGIQELLKEPDRVFIEAGPGQTLTSLTKLHTSSGAPQRAFPSLGHPTDQISDEQHIIGTLGQLWLLGVEIDWSGFYSKEQRRRVPLPTYPFERQRYWVEESKEVSLSTKSQSHRQEFEKWFYVPSWKRRAIDHTVAEKSAEKRVSWLLFIDPCGLGANLARQLKELGQLAAVVSIGEEYEKKSNDTYVINPGEPKDFRTLFESLSFLGRLPTKIIHLWSVTPDARKNRNRNGSGVDSSLDLSFYSLLYLAQTLGEQASELQIELKVISNELQEVTGDETCVPEKSLVLGPCRVVSQEFENIQCSSIDVVLPESAAKAEKFNELLLDEIFANTTDSVVAHRGAHRWVECFEPTHVPAERAGKPALRKNGVYLITGGLGGIGLALAEHLAQTVGASLVLIARQPLPGRAEWKQWIEQHDAQDPTTLKLRKIETLERLGSEVLVINADVTNEQEMKRAIDQVRSRFGAINGVIHAAGVAGGGIMQIKTRQAAERVLSGKVHGTIALKNALAGEKPDFVVLCSTINSFLGGVGQVDYCAANAFLDAYARKHRSENFISINWYAWQEVGMAVNTKVPQELQAERARSLKMGIRPGEGAEAFSRILNQSSPQIIVSPEEVSVQIERHSTPHSKGEEIVVKEKGKKYARPQISSNYLAPRNETEKALVEIWQQVLGIDKVGVQDDFFKLGGHSLLALTVFAKIKKLTGKEIPLATLFEAPTVEKLAAVVGGGEVAIETGQSGRSNLIVPIKPTGARTPFFCVHGVGGAVLEYSHMASYLDPDQPFYGIQAQGLDGKEAWLKTIEEMATRYVQEIKRIQPNGPYSIGGSSFGGIVAYEMAQQLHASGEQVALLAFFDSYGKDYPTPLPSLGISRHRLLKSMARWEMHINNLRMMQAREWPGYVREKLAKLPVRWQRKMKKLKQNVRFLFLPRVLRNQFKWTGDDGGDLWHFKLPKSYTQVATANYRSCLNYRHKPYSGNAVLFRATKQPVGIHEDPTNGWGTLIQGGLEIFEVPGYHGAIVREPLVRKLAEELNPILNRNVVE
ncbi:MAG: amino acid adenylation domain-containing protein [Verrucomicrobia bacterium]|nr:amino acid adenylation domain-containing protein [Verrucomicrobiota bacterium]